MTECVVLLVTCLLLVLEWNRKAVQTGQCTRDLAGGLRGRLPGAP